MSLRPVVRPEIRALAPWYHDFRRLGLVTEFGRRRPGPRELARRALGWLAAAGARRRLGLPRPAFAPRLPSHLLNQRAKENELLPLLDQAIAGLGPGPRMLDLFCSDGYYACWLNRAAPGSLALGVDRELRELVRARTAAHVLGCPGAAFVRADVPAFVGAVGAAFDLVLCAGGLYHLEDPRGLLAALRRCCRGLLVVQSVVTLESEAAEHFVRPAPGWRHGCRFSDAALRSWLEELGWVVLEHRRGELPANRRRCDRGSTYLLARCPGSRARPAAAGEWPARPLRTPHIE